MPHELFVIDRKEQLDVEESKRAAYLRDKLTTVKNLGLTAQAATVAADLATIVRGRLITTPPMSDTELVIWRAWLPTAYTDNGDTNGHYKLADYQFDRIPSPVLKMWEQYKQSGLFERFEIWTPEMVQPDPILVGVNGNARHLLARWGESDANLVSFDDIKRELVRRWYKDEPIGNEPWEQRWARTERKQAAVFAAIFSTMGIFFLVAMGLSFLLQSPHIGLPVGGVVAMVSGVAIFYYIHKNQLAKALAMSDLMQAIAKDISRPRNLLPA